MIAGEAVSLTVFRQTIAGAPSTTATFSVDAFVNGTSYSAANTATLIGETSDGLWNAYKIALTISSTSGNHELRIAAASGTDVVEPSIWGGEAEQYDSDALAGLLLTSQGTPAVRSQADSDLGQVVDGDSYLSDVLTIPLGKISPWGYNSLTPFTMSVAAKSSNTTAAAITFSSATVVDAALRTVRFGYTAMPSEMALAAAEKQKDWYIDVQFKDTSMTPNRIITGGRYKLTVVWERNEA
jgi:hypothetical protein